MRAAYFEPGTAPYLVAHKLMRAKNLKEFRAAAVTWGTPSCNLVFADKAGDIAWMPAGINPIRPNWDGLMPVRATGATNVGGLPRPGRGSGHPQSVARFRSRHKSR